ncbi:hypothetical protein LWI29_006155 [Acer saccharum]|uniref:Uncharacterized protein n=1 Tax=Acer saccharum TaxID=4024 RepID=A0AA39VHN1_ACESA|nr:hypothetical protein LWI29_006155 [Acer saccharum]
MCDFLKNHRIQRLVNEKSRLQILPSCCSICWPNNTLRNNSPQLLSFNFAQLPNTNLQLLHDLTLDHNTGHGFATSHDSSDFLCLRRRTPVKQRTANNLDHFDAPKNSSDLVNRHLGFDPGRLLKILVVVVVTVNSPAIMAAADGKVSQLVTPSWADSDGKTTSFGFELLEGLVGLHLLVWVVSSHFPAACGLRGGLSGVADCCSELLNPQLLDSPTTPGF